MAYVLKTNLANKGNYGSVRSTSQIKYIVIHYTSNDGDTDENNGTYFKNNDVDSSAHYFVDSDSVTQSVPDNYVAWSVGGSKYSNCSSTGGGKYYNIGCDIYVPTESVDAYKSAYRWSEYADDIVGYNF